MIKFRHSVAFHLALICGGFVIASTALLSAVFYFGTVGILDQKADRKISATAERLVEIADHNDWMTVSDQIRQDLGDGIDSDTEIYLLRDAQGQTLAGNISNWSDETAPQDQIIDHSVIRNGKPSSTRLLLRRFQDGTLLIVGRDMTDLTEIGGLVVRAICTGGGLALILSVLGTVLFRQKIEKRIEVIRHTARDIQLGDLSQRINTSSKTDEFDRLGADINNMLDRIETLMNGVRNVSNMVAHNVRTPLGRIRGRLEKVVHGDWDSQELDTAGAYAIEQIDGLITLLDKLLQISEAESGTRRQPFTLVKLSDVVLPILDLYDAACEAQGAALIAQVDEAAVVFGDKDLLICILANLLDNALKYASGTATIEVRASHDAQRVILVVEDRGPGIPHSEHEKVLGRFYRIHGRGQGNGLGLPIVVALTTLHGGAVFLEDAEPGLRVRITLPIVETATLPNGNVSRVLKTARP